MPLTTALSPDIPPVLGDRVQLQQVILNLIFNACDAMSALDPAERELTLTTVADDGFVQIAVSDCGDDTSIAGWVDLCHGAFGEVAAVGDLPLVVYVGQHGAN